MLKFGRCYHLHEAKITRFKRVSKRYCMYVQILAVAYGGVSMFFTYRLQPFIWNYGTFSCALLSVCFYLCWCLARLQLDAAFHLLPEYREGLLVTTGLYKYCSHPLYLFSSLCLCSYLLLIGRPMLLLSMIVIIPVQIWRARQEAQVLREMYGDLYERYIETVII